jgi:hypothetical protein
MLTTMLALRLARKWQTAWEATRKPKPAFDAAWDRVEGRFDIAQRIRQRLEFVRDRQFTVGLRNLTADLGYHLGELGHLVSSLRNDLMARPPRTPDLASWLANVRQLEDEFSDVEVIWKKSVVRVVTEPIELRDVELGPFAIDFHWDRLGSKSGPLCFDIVALEPNPAQGNPDVCHPHVLGHTICAGDAKKPIENALEQGHFPEAFLLLRSVLTTYNSSSPYIRLDVWTGKPCKDCGDRVGEDSRYACEACGDENCDHCIRACTICHSSQCSSCLDDCAVCHSTCCSNCLETVADDERVCRKCFVNCGDCGARVPKDELTDNLCSACQPSEEEPDDDDPVDEGDEEPLRSDNPEAPDVLGNGLAEVPVPLPCRAD